MLEAAGDVSGWLGFFPQVVTELLGSGPLQNDGVRPDLISSQDKYFQLSSRTFLGAPFVWHPLKNA